MLNSRKLTILIILNLFSVFSWAVDGLPGKFHFSGLLTDSANSPLLDSSITLKLGVYNPAGDCLLYEETQIVNTSTSGGKFSVLVGAGSTTGAGANLSLRNSMFGFLSVTGVTGCGSGYTASPGDFRKLKVTITPSSTGVPEDLSPLFTIAPSPSALVAESLSDGLTSDQILKTNASVPQLTQANLENIFNQYSALSALVAGTSNLYASKSTAAGNIVSSYSGAPGSPTAGSLWYDTTSNQMKYHNGTAAQTFSVGGSGTVTSITAGTGLTGGSITTTGTIAVDTGLTANKIVQLDGSARLPAVDGSLLTNLNINASNITTGVLPINRGGTNTTSFTANKIVGTNGTGTSFVDFSCALNEVIKFDAGGNAGCSVVDALLVSAKLNKNGDAMTGALGLVDGTAPAPSLNFASDTNTGFYKPAADVLGFTTNGISRMIIDSTGNVGIGTSSPGGLTVGNSSNADTNVLVTSNGASGKSIITIDSSGQTTLNLMSNFSGSPFQGVPNQTTGIMTGNPFPLILGTNQVERMRILASGNIGIGEVNPGQKLFVNGNAGAVRLYTSLVGTSGSPAVAIGGSPSTLSSTGLFSASGPDLSIASQGVRSGEFRYVAGAVNHPSFAPSPTGLAVQLEAAGGDTNISIALVPKGTGKVGIGTTTPSDYLHINSGANSNLLRLESTSSTTDFVMAHSGGSSKITTENVSGSQIVLDAGNNGPDFVVKNNGNVGIGTNTPATRLHVEGVIAPYTNNLYTLGNASYRFTEVFATNGTINTSDRREKKEIYTSDLGLDFISRLRPVSYRWNTGVDNDIHYGLIAQEAKQAIAESDKSDKTSIVTYDKTADRYGVRYSELIAPLIKAAQELYALIKETDHEMALLKSENAHLKNENSEIKAWICAKDNSASFCP